MTVLHRAVFVADETIVRSLLDDPRVDVNLGDRRQNTPLHLAARRGYEPVLRMLLDCPRVNVNALNAAGCTPLAFAVDGSTEEIIGMLISNSRVDVNLPDPNLQTPLCIAAKRARYSAVKLLLEREDLDVNYRCHYGMTPLAHAADEPFKERTPPEHYQKIIKLLGTDQRVDVNLADRHLETPLHKAVRARGPNLVKELLRQRGIAVNARDQDGYTPLCLATRMAEREEHKGIVQALRAAQRVDVNAQDNKGTALGGKGLAPDDSARGAGNLPMSLFGIRKSFSGGTDKKVDVPGKDMG
ncbi:ankyrin, partial [Tuber magnatum]